MANEFILDISFHPGETLAEKLGEMKMGTKEFAVRTGKPEKTINAVLKGESAVTPDMAVLFEDVLQIPARFLLKRQYEYDEYVARQKRQAAIENAADWAMEFPYAEMAKLGWLPTSRKLQEKVTSLFRFFKLSSHEAWEEYFYRQQLKVAFRISLYNSKSPHALSAWIRQGEIQAEQMEGESYDKQKIQELLPELRSLMAKQPTDFFTKLQQRCLSCGVKVIYTPSIAKAPISGATRWVKDHPIIQLTGRYKQNDRFWFTMFHEIGHIILHGKKDIFLEGVEYDDFDSDKEKEADDFAVKWTLSQEEEKEIVTNGTTSEEDVLRYASKFNTHPALIIGRLQKRGLIPYSEGRQFFVPISLTDC